jgi:hypothetical protein
MKNKKENNIDIKYGNNTDNNTDNKNENSKVNNMVNNMVNRIEKEKVKVIIVKIIKKFIILGMFGLGLGLIESLTSIYWVP